MQKLKFIWVTRGDVADFHPIEVEASPNLGADLLSAYGEVQGPDNPYPPLDYWVAKLLEKQFEAEEIRELESSQESLQYSDALCESPQPQKRKSSPFGVINRTSPRKLPRLDSLTPLAKVRNVKHDLDRISISSSPSPRSPQNRASTERIFDLTFAKQNRSSSWSPPTDLSQGIWNTEAVDDIVTFYIGKPEKPFSVPRKSVDDLGCFRDVKVWETNSGWVMRRPAYQNLNPKNFISIAEYLSVGDFSPRLLDRGTKDVHLENITSPTERQQALIKCAKTWEIAREMLIEELMELLAEKLTALNPWPIHGLLIFAKAVFSVSSTCDADDHIRESISKYLVANLLAIVQEEPSNLYAKFEELPMLHKMVLEMQLEKVDKKLSEKGD